MEKICLNNVEVSGNLIKYHYSVSHGLKKYFMTECMFIEYEEDIENVPLSILTIPFVNCMAGIMWMSDSVLFVDEIDSTYYYALRRLKTAYHELHHYMELKGLFVPSKIISNTIQKSDSAVLLFGGGVDCHTSFLRNRDSISHIFNIYGWLKSIDEVNKVDVSDKEQTTEYAALMGSKSLHARSNFAAQFNLKAIDKAFGKSLQTGYWYGFLHPMAFTSIATPIAWIKGISKIMIASSFTKDRADVHCASFITTDSEFRFAENGITLHDGFELNRNDKVALLVDYQKQTGKPYKLQACSFNDHNCCECEKCFRTICDIISLNGDPRDFGFNNIKGSMKEHWARIVNRDVAMWGTSKESYYYYYYSAKKMQENYEQIKDKEFVDWFLSCDFAAMKKKALRKYYCRNFISIVKRKLHL